MKKHTVGTWSQNTIRYLNSTTIMPNSKMGDGKRIEKERLLGNVSESKVHYETMLSQNHTLELQCFNTTRACLLSFRAIRLNLNASSRRARGFFHASTVRTLSLNERALSFAVVARPRTRSCTDEMNRPPISLSWSALARARTCRS